MRDVVMVDWSTKDALTLERPHCPHAPYFAPGSMAAGSATEDRLLDAWRRKHLSCGAFCVAEVANG